MDLLQRLFKSVSGETRIKILILLLRKGELSVGDIASELDRKISTISRNLSILEQNNFVASRHLGANVYYRIKDDPKWSYNRAILRVLRLRLEETKIRERLHIS